MDVVLKILPHANSLVITSRANALTVEAIDIYTQRYFLQPFQVLEQHEEV